MEERQHVAGGLVQVIIGGDAGNRHGVGEPIDCERVADAVRDGYVALVAAVTGPTYQPLTPCGAMLLRWWGISWTTRVPGGASGHLLKSWFPLRQA